MSQQVDRAKRLSALMSMPGWKDIVDMIDEQAQDCAEELLTIMSRKPDTLTGKTAIKLASRRSSLLDFKESVEDEVKVLLPREDSK